MLLVPGTLPANSATLKALCAGLAAHSDVATLLRSATVEPFSGSWSDAEREALALSGNALPSSSHHSIATPLHAALGLTDLIPLDPANVPLTDDESRALCEAADAHLRVEGVRLAFVNANSWAVTCAREISALTERPEWLIGEPLRPNLPRGNDARLLERWMNELQMLLFADPVNAAREARGLPPINVIWLWGFGTERPTHEPPVLPPLPQAGEGWGEGGGARTKFGQDTHTITPSPSPACGRGEHIPREFVTALRNGNVPCWQSAWQLLAPEILSADSIILGDSRPRLRITPRKASAAEKLVALFQRKPTLAAALVALQKNL